MTIRRTLLFSFLAVSLVPTALLTFLAFAQARDALQTEIADHLRAQASTAMEHIDWMLFERMENVRIWRQLEVLQDIRLRDVDKRVSRVLADLKAGNDVYEMIFCTTPEGEVVAASNPQAVGQQLPSSTPWLTVDLFSGPIVFDSLAFAGSSRDARLAIHTPIPDAFRPGEVIGTLYAMFEWQQIMQILDDTERDSSTGNAGRGAALLDHDGVIIAASSLLRRREFLLSPALAFWPPVRTEHNGAMTADGRPLGEADVLVGYAHSRGYQHFAGFGWSTVVVQPIVYAFVPIRRMGLAFAILLALTGASAVGASLFIAARLAQPIVGLTKFTRKFSKTEALPPPPTHRRGEVGELTVAFLQMVQDLEQSREDLIRAAKLAVVGEMAASMAHEVRTPLGIIRSSAQMIQREPHLSGEGREMASFVVSETDRLNRLISTLLNLARPRPPVFREVNVHQILQHVAELLAPRLTRRNILLSEEYAATSPQLVCDEEQLLQVFLNLVLNAVQVLSEGGRILLRTADVEDSLMIEVADNGPGIKPGDQTHVFDPFFTTRAEGIGLGLTIVQQIVRTHGGEIHLVETPLGGACFRILLPHTRSNSTDDETTSVSG